MAEIKSSTKGWVIGAAVVALLAIGVFVFMRSTASADVAEPPMAIVQGVGYSFEILSKNKLTAENLTPLGSTSSVTNYRIKEPVGVSSGFALRIRHNGSNQIINKNIKWIRSSSEGFFSLQKNDALVGVYPITSGGHQISAEIGTGSSKETIVLSFSTTGYSTTPTPIRSVVASPTIPPSQYSPTPTAAPSLVLTPTTSCTADSTGRQICEYIQCTTNSTGQTTCS